MDSYYLFLDETTPNPSFPYFCLAGCCIEQNVYEKSVIPAVEQLKLDIFGDRCIVLHEYDIRDCKEPFSNMKDNETRKSFWDKLNTVFDSIDMKIFGTVVETNKHQELYSGQNVSDVYFVALQIIMENYVHFLDQVNGQGCMILESRNPTQDLRLQNHYHNLVANGTLFLTNNAMQKHLSTISFILKTDNNIGLQLADFIPNAAVRHYCPPLKQKNPTIIEPIKAKLYDGSLGLPDRFGIKLIP